MNPRWIKEIRPLLLPWCTAAVGMAVAIILPDDPIFQGVGYSLLACSVAVMASLPFGLEFQHSTWALLLGQPVERARLWGGKLQAAMLPLVALVLVCWRFAIFVRDPS